MKSFIIFSPLREDHFPLLLKWLENPHVKSWWDQDIIWTSDLIQEKYGSYPKGYKAVSFPQNTKKPIAAFIIRCNKANIGYIQFYNFHDFPRDFPCTDLVLPEKCAAIDWYIGDQAFVGKGIASQILAAFLEKIVSRKFDYCFVDPDTSNNRAIRVYEKAGFHTLKIINDGKITCMLTDLKRS
jgi:aminoglycoside 6'-N-acetyltransferase